MSHNSKYYTEKLMKRNAKAKESLKKEDLFNVWELPLRGLEAKTESNNICGGT